VAAPAKKSATSSLNKVTPIPGNLSIPATRAAIDEAVLAVVNNDDNDDNDDDAAASDAGDYDYFGDMPNPDPEDVLPRDLRGDFLLLFLKSRKHYTKARKVGGFL
jgi:hypothetical protein